MKPQGLVSFSYGLQWCNLGRVGEVFSRHF